MTETRIPRRTRRRSRMPVLLLLCAAVLVAGLLAAVVISLRPVKVPDPEPDPHEGQVYINDGASMVWHTPLEGVPVSGVEQDEFVRDGERIRYTGASYATRWGVDVSNYQGSIDWQALKAQGIEFAYLRLGLRGYGEQGTLYTCLLYTSYRIMMFHGRALSRPGTRTLYLISPWLTSTGLGKQEADMIYLDNAATTPVPKAVADAVYDVLLHHCGNPSSQYPAGQEMRCV